MTTLGGEVALSSSIDFSLLKRESSEKDRTLRSGGAIGVSLLVVGVSDASLVSAVCSFALGICETVSHMKIVESAATVTSCVRGLVSAHVGLGSSATSVMPSV